MSWHVSGYQVKSQSKTTRAIRVKGKRIRDIFRGIPCIENWCFVKAKERMGYKGDWVSNKIAEVAPSIKRRSSWKTA